MPVTAPNWTFNIDQGASVALAITIKDSSGNVADPTGYAAHMQVREHLDAPATLLDLSTDTAGITVDTVNKRFVISQTADQTAAYTWQHGVYDLFITSPNGTRARILQGEAEVSAAVTVS